MYPLLVYVCVYVTGAGPGIIDDWMSFGLIGLQVHYTEHQVSVLCWRKRLACR